MGLSDRQIKTLLAGVPVRESGFPLAQTGSEKQALVPVSACPRCGKPVYGPREVRAPTSGGLVTYHTCDCFAAKSFADTILTK